MALQAHGRNRPDNVVLRPFLSYFISELIRVTGWEGNREEYCAGRVKGRSPENGGSPSDPGRYAVGYLFKEMLSKFDDGRKSTSKEQTTWDRFHKAEDACASTNRRLRNHDPALFSTERTGVYSLLEAARRKISWLLGPLDLDEVHGRMEFTSGASTRLPRRMGHQVYKFSSKKETTSGNLAFANAVIQHSPLFNGRPVFGEGPCDHPSRFLEVVPGNKLISVPKNYKTDRTIAIEPDMNMYVQKGFGTTIRRRLRRVGIDLDNGQQTNQDLALLGSKTGLLATIDLSMASDTVSRELVELLMPPDWFSCLEQARSQYGVLPSGERLYYQKFSSMGNGFTFELETLIFWALAVSVAEAYGAGTSLIAVYGDDIIVPATVSDPLCSLLEFCGFTPNLDKTFSSGPFRESCGKHYLSGFDVSPFYVKSEDTTLMGLFKLHNQAYRWFSRLERDGIRMPGWRSLLAALRGRAPQKWRKPRIPDGLGDGSFIGTFDECTPSRPVSSDPERTGWEGWYVVVLAESARVQSPFELLEWNGSGIDLTGAMSWQLSRRSSANDPLFVRPSCGGVVRSRRVRRIQIVVQHF